MADSIINSLADASYRSLDAYPTTYQNDGSKGLAKVANQRTGSNSNNSNFDYSSAGVQTQENALKEANQKVKDQVLTQEDFLKLLTTQLQAQDPTKPADNNQLVTQMSQLSMVESLNSINSNMDNVLSQVGTSAAMNATNLIGTYVYTDQKNGYFGGNVNAPAIWSVDAGDETYYDVQLTIKDANTGEIVYKDTANSLTGEIKYGWSGYYSPDGPIQPPTDTQPDQLPDEGEGDSNAGTDGITPDSGAKLANDTTGDGSTGEGGDGSQGGNGDTTKPGDGDQNSGDKDPQYTLCGPGKYVIEVTGKNANGETVSIPVKGLGFVSSVSLGKTLSDTMLNLNGLGQIPFDKANHVTL